MKKILLIFTTLITFALSLPLVVTPVSSANCVLNVVSAGEPTVNNPLSFYIDNAVPGSDYRVNLFRDGFGVVYDSGLITASGTTINLQVPGSSLSVVGLYEFTSFRLGNIFEDCSDPPPFNVSPAASGIVITVTGPTGENNLNLPSVQAKSEIWYNVTVTGLEPNTGYHLKIFRVDGYSPPAEGQHAEGTESLCGYPDDAFHKDAISDGTGGINERFGDSLLPDNPPTGNFIFEVATSKMDFFGGGFLKDCVRDQYVAHIPIRIVDTPQNYVPGVGPIDLISGQNPCAGGVSCNTALGTIGATLGEFTGKLLLLGIGLAGGIALILMVVGAIRVLTSSGDPQKLGSGREIIIAALVGLLFLIFSVLILRFIGVQIIGL